ncbi:hypothetical protein RZN22_15665 [Bacillaceae bacterium S4-13-58]
MILEMLNEILSDFSPFYLYVGFLLFFAFSYATITIAPHYVTSNSYYISNTEMVDFIAWCEHRILGLRHRIQTWISEKIKRKESPENDSEGHHCCSFLHLDYKSQGGQQCLYSLPQKNIV